MVSRPLPALTVEDLTAQLIWRVVGPLPWLRPRVDAALLWAGCLSAGAVDQRYRRELRCLARGGAAVAETDPIGRTHSPVKRAAAAATVTAERIASLREGAQHPRGPPPWSGTLDSQSGGAPPANTHRSWCSRVRAQELLCLVEEDIRSSSAALMPASLPTRSVPQINPVSDDDSTRCQAHHRPGRARRDRGFGNAS